MKFILILLTLVLATGDAARRPTTPATDYNVPGRQIRLRGQHPGNVWDLIELQKLDNPDFWNKNPTSATNITESEDSIKLTGRQSYPGQTNPGDSNELPGPIVTIKPITPVDPPPGCQALRGQFPSSKNCANYLNCWDGVVVEQSCPEGLLFNAVSLVCDYDYNVNCGDRPKPTPKPSLPNGSKLCPDSNGRYRSATNCSEFYVCVFGKPVKFSCPRGLVYNDVVNVCDYPYNVDCKGAATPKPTPTPTTASPPTQTSQATQPTQPTQPPTYPSQPTYPTNPNPNPYPTNPNPSYPTNPNPSYPNPWLQRAEPSPLDVDTEEDEDDEEFTTQQQARSPQPEFQSQNPWNLIQNIPVSLTTVPCENGDLHRLNNSCTNVVVCRNGRPQLVQCSTGLAYDRSSDACKPISVAKC